MWTLVLAVDVSTQIRLRCISGGSAAARISSERCRDRERHRHFANDCLPARRSIASACLRNVCRADSSCGRAESSPPRNSSSAMFSSKTSSSSSGGTSFVLCSPMSKPSSFSRYSARADRIAQGPIGVVQTPPSYPALAALGFGLSARTIRMQLPAERVEALLQILRVDRSRLRGDPKQRRK